MLKKIGKWIRNHLFNFYDNCYADMEHRGIASMNCCCGVVGGTRATDYLSETCISCPYLVLVAKDKKIKRTNADRIRSMSDEELYSLIEKIKMCGGLIRTETTSSECRGCKDGFCCNVLQWLKAEVEG